MDFSVSQVQTRLLDFIDHPSTFFENRPTPVVSGVELAGLTLIEERAAHPFPVDWERIAAWLRAKLSQPPGGDQEVIIRSFYKLTTAAPDAVVESLVRVVNQMHPAWSSLLFYIWSRRRTLPLLQGLNLPPPRYAQLTLGRHPDGRPGFEPGPAPLASELR